jgi:hypothetical protein
MDGICTVCGASWSCEHVESSDAAALQPLLPAAPVDGQTAQAAIEAIERLHDLLNDPSSSASQAALGFHDTPWIDLTEPF